MGALLSILFPPCSKEIFHVLHHLLGQQGRLHAEDLDREKNHICVRDSHRFKDRVLTIPKEVKFSGCKVNYNTAVVCEYETLLERFEGFMRLSVIAGETYGVKCLMDISTT